jgi:hypothetical protein
MVASYPLHIRTLLRAGKSRTQPAKFTVAEPRRGYAYVKPIGTDVPVFWDIEFRFTGDEAIVFKLWFDEIIAGGVDEFTLPIRTEFGTVTHTCHFLPDGLLPATEAGQTWGYKATIMARALVTPAGYSEAAELIVGLPDWRTWAELLDLGITQEMPDG